MIRHATKDIQPSKTPPNIILIRHGQSESNLDQENGNIRGKSNHYPLTEIGREQAKLAGEYLGNTYDLSGTNLEIISSPALRAQETIQIIRAKLQLDTHNILIDPRLEERGYGDWEGKKESETITPEMLRAMDASRGQFRPPNGDSIQDIYDRTRLFLDTICGSDKHYLICSHGFTIRCLLGNILGIHPGDIYNPIKGTPGIYNAGIIELIHYDDHMNIAHDIRTASFLEEHLRTK